MSNRRRFTIPIDHLTFLGLLRGTAAIVQIVEEELDEDEDEYDEYDEFDDQPWEDAEVYYSEAGFDDFGAIDPNTARLIQHQYWQQQYLQQQYLQRQYSPQSQQSQHSQQSQQPYPQQQGWQQQHQQHPRPLPPADRSRFYPPRNRSLPPGYSSDS